MSAYYDIIDWLSYRDSTGATRSTLWERGAWPVPVLATLREAGRERFVPKAWHDEPGVMNTYSSWFNMENEVISKAIPLKVYDEADNRLLDRAKVLEACGLPLAWAYRIAKGRSDGLFQGIGDSWNRTGAGVVLPEYVDITGSEPGGWYGWPILQYDGFEQLKKIAELAGYPNWNGQWNSDNGVLTSRCKASNYVMAREILKQCYVYMLGVASSHSWEAAWFSDLTFESKSYQTPPGPYQGSGTWQECMDGFDATPWAPAAQVQGPYSACHYTHDAWMNRGWSWGAVSIRVSGKLRFSDILQQIKCHARVFLSVSDLDSSGYVWSPTAFALHDDCGIVEDEVSFAYEPPHPSTLSMANMPPGGTPGNTGIYWTHSWRPGHPIITCDFKVPGGFRFV